MFSAGLQDVAPLDNLQTMMQHTDSRSATARILTVHISPLIRPFTEFRLILHPPFRSGEVQDQPKTKTYLATFYEERVTAHEKGKLTVVFQIFKLDRPQ